MNWKRLNKHFYFIRRCRILNTDKEQALSRKPYFLYTNPFLRIMGVSWGRMRIYNNDFLFPHHFRLQILNKNPRHVSYFYKLLRPKLNYTLSISGNLENFFMYFFVNFSEKFRCHLYFAFPNSERYPAKQ